MIYATPIYVTRSMSMEDRNKNEETISVGIESRRHIPRFIMAPKSKWNSPKGSHQRLELADLRSRKSRSMQPSGNKLKI